MKITEEKANKIWDILVNHAGCNEKDRLEFISYFTDGKNDLKEYRCRGVLGWGGKVKCFLDSVYVSFYSEDYTPEREVVKQKVNWLLRELFPNPYFK